MNWKIVRRIRSKYLFWLIFVVVALWKLTNIAEHCDVCEIYDVHQDNDFDYECVEMMYVPQTRICIYPVDEDVFISKLILETGQWETDQVMWMQEELRNDPDLGLIDIGANIGVFSLMAAAMGHNVLSVEPKLRNVRRLHKAIKLAHFEDRITLVKNVVSDRRTLHELSTALQNQGGITAKDVGEDKRKNITDNELYVRSITMNDLVPLCKFRRAFLKMDIERGETKAIAAADHLFDVIDIPYIEMEWMHYKIKQKKNETEVGVLKMMNFFKERNYRPETMSHKPLDFSKHKQWPGDITWRRMIPS